MMKAKRWGTRMRACSLSLALLACGIVANSVTAQQTYQLMVPDGSAYSEASVSANRLEIRDSAGRLTRYDRLAAWDSSDGFWLAFRNPATGQVVRWPSNSRGPVQIGSPDAGNRLRFRESQMQIQALQNLPSRPAPGVAMPGNAVGGGVARGDAYWRLAMRDGRDLYLASSPGGGVTLQPGNAIGNVLVDWMVVPVQDNLVRLQVVRGGQWYALAGDPGGRSVRLIPARGDAFSLWRMIPGYGESMVLECVAFPGLALGWDYRQLGLFPLSFQPQQLWYPLPLAIAAPSAAVAPAPTYRIVQQQVIPNQPLPPALVQLTNVHSEAVVLRIDDLLTGASEVVEIPAGQRLERQFERDSGSTVVETHEWVDPLGNVTRQEYSNPIPAAERYDISVYEKFLQSIAIDRTGKSPNKIEDINYQPKSVGRFVVPAGERLPERASIDVFGQARQANNPGGVRRIQMPASPVANPDPLREILDRARQGR
ncbi:MAG: hypothetical protein ACK5PD_01500 [Pirellulaceae bacterium]